jgi:hypothetical protein
MAGCVADCPVSSHPIVFELAIGFGLAVAVLALTVRVMLGKPEKYGVMLGQPEKRSKTTALPAAASWSFSDSWATNITAVMTAVGAVGTAVADKFPNVVAESSVLEFGVGGAFLGVIAVLAPVAYAAASKSPVGTARGEDDVPGGGRWPSLLAAAAMTLTGAFGSLIGVLVLTVDARLGDWTKAWIWILCLASLGLIAWYAFNTLRWVLEATMKEPAGVARFAGLFTVSCCGGQAGSVRVRVALL